MKILLTILFCAWLAVPVQACEVLVKARSIDHPDADEDRRGRMKRGMIQDVRPDGFQWGTREELPRFVVIKIPMISEDKLWKYLVGQFSGTNPDGTPILYRIRKWQIRWADLPAAARNKLANNGELTIKATAAYTGSYDYTWAQIKGYFRNLETGLDETNDL